MSARGRVVDFPSARADHAPGPTLGITVPASFVDAIAERTAALLVEHLAAAASPDAWLDVDAAAAYLACPPSRIYDLVGLSRLRVAKDGRRSLFRREWLDDALVLPESDR